ncbi:hypothetical protein Tco_0183640 [Tanacetum coccineum]
MRKSKSYEKHPTHQALYDALVQSLIMDEDDIEKAKIVEPLTQKKRRHDDKDQDPPARPDQGLKKRKTNKDVEPSKKPKSTGSSKGTSQSQLKSNGKSVQAEETVFEATDTDMPLNQGDDTGNTNEQPNVEAVTKDDWFKKPPRPPTPDPEWNTRKSVDDGPGQNWLNDLASTEKPPLRTPIDLFAFAMNRLEISKLTKADLTNPEGERCPYDLSKPLPLHESRGRLTVPANFFFNNDLEYLRAGSTNRKYTTSTTKTKAAKYELEGIEDMVPKLWSPIKIAYDKVSRHDVYSTMRIMSVTSVTVDKWYGYGRLWCEEQIRNFTSSWKKRVEDLQLGVESYQKKLNISKPHTRDVDISFKEPYTTHSNPQGVIYGDKLKRKRLMHIDELYKFTNGTLTLVCNTLQQMLLNFQLGQNWRDLPRDIPLDRIEVLRYDTKGVKVRKGIMQTKTELTLEQTQQGVSDEVLISIERVEE